MTLRTGCGGCIPRGRLTFSGIAFCRPATGRWAAQLTPPDSQEPPACRRPRTPRRLVAVPEPRRHVCVLRLRQRLTPSRPRRSSWKDTAALRFWRNRWIMYIIHQLYVLGISARSDTAAPRSRQIAARIGTRSRRTPRRHTRQDFIAIAMCVRDMTNAGSFQLPPSFVGTSTEAHD